MVGKLQTKGVRDASMKFRISVDRGHGEVNTKPERLILCWLKMGRATASDHRRTVSVIPPNLRT